jgi:hypothetical protein
MMGALLESIGSGKENSSNNKFTDTADDFKKKN